MRGLSSLPFADLLLAVVGSVWVVGLCGCGGNPEPAAPTGPPKDHKATAKGRYYKVVDTANLPKLTVEVTHPFAGGQLNRFGPTGWTEIPPTQLRDDQVVGFYQKELGSPPLIVVRSAPWPDHGIPMPLEENLDAVFDIVGKKIESELAKNEPLIEDLKLMLIGERPWVRCVRHLAFTINGKRVPGERQVLKTVEGNRLITVELQVAENKILETRDQAYSVAAHLFDKDPAAEKPPETPMPMPEEKPAEKGK